MCVLVKQAGLFRRLTSLLHSLLENRLQWTLGLEIRAVLTVRPITLHCDSYVVFHPPTTMEHPFSVR